MRLLKSALPYILGKNAFCFNFCSKNFKNFINAYIVSNKTYPLAVPTLGRVRTHADKHKPHSFSFECGVLVAAERNALGKHCRRTCLLLAWLADIEFLNFFRTDW